tara:strand:- start:277 stop:1026 length:750 start_codon:yes stop_codon:yes gene_type:complete
MKKNRFVSLVIQARMDSVRLPGKSMMKLAGIPMVGRIIERVCRCKSVDKIILAVPEGDANKVLVELGESYGVSVFQGSENNLIDRFYNALKEFKTDIVVRFPADNPVPEPEEIDRIVNHHLSLNKKGFSSNLAEINNSKYPDGIGAEVFDFCYLEELMTLSLSDKKKEHIHLNFYDYQSGIAVNESWCPINTVNCPESFSRPDLVLDVNTIDQYNFMSDLYDNLYPKNQNFHITDIINWHDNKNKRKIK